jgi:hypothetical protein
MYLKLYQKIKFILARVDAFIPEMVDAPQVNK